LSKNNVYNFMSNIDRDSWVHRLDPRTKIAMLLFFSSLPLLFTDPLYILGFILLSLPLWMTARINFRSLQGPLVGVAGFLFTIFLLNVFRSRAEITTQFDYFSAYTWLIDLGPVVITSHTVQRATFLALRLMVPFTIGLLMITTTEPTYLAKGLRKLQMPIAVVFMVLAGLRFIPIVTEQLFHILDAQTIRGVSSSRLARSKLLLLPLFLSSLRRTRTMGLACEAKGFSAHRWNHFIEDFRMDRIDKLLLIALLLLTIAVLVIRFYFGLGFALVGSLK
jgi:energy-coupling factor transport system permease protein